MEEIGPNFIDLENKCVYLTFTAPWFKRNTLELIM